MLTVSLTNLIVSKGYNGAPAIKVNDKNTVVRFRIGHKVYDTNAENNTRWINLPIKAFGKACERILKMQLKEGSHINIAGHLDEEVWEDESTHEKRRQLIVIADDIEYSGGGSKSDNSGKSGGYNNGYGAAPQTPNSPNGYGNPPQNGSYGYGNPPQNGGYAAPQNPNAPGNYGAAPQNPNAPGYGAAPQNPNASGGYGGFTGYEGYAPGSGNAFYG